MVKVWGVFGLGGYIYGRLQKKLGGGSSVSDGDGRYGGAKVGRRRRSQVMGGDLVKYISVGWRRRAATEVVGAEARQGGATGVGVRAFASWGRNGVSSFMEKNRGRKKKDEKSKSGSLNQDLSDLIFNHFLWRQTFTNSTTALIPLYHNISIF